MHGTFVAGLSIMLASLCMTAALKEFGLMGMALGAFLILVSIFQ